MPHKTIIRLSGVARNPANGFPARPLVGLGAFFAVSMFVNFFFVSGAAVDHPPRVVGGFLLVAMAGTLLGWSRYAPWGRPIVPKAGAWIGMIGLAGMLAFGGLHLAGEITEIL